MDTDTVTPAAHYSFNINKDAEEQKKQMSEVFHMTTAKLYNIIQRAWPDIKTTVSFLMK